MKTAAGPDQIRGVREVLGWLIRRRGSRKFAEPLLAKAGLPAELAEALDDTSWDADLQAETDHALSLTGRDVGTPIIHFQPPHGTAFFGPVISRPPAGEDAVHLWDYVVGLARSPASPSSSAACASAPSSAATASTLDRPEPKKTGKPATDAPQADSSVKAANCPLLSQQPARLFTFNL